MVRQVTLPHAAMSSRPVPIWLRIVSLTLRTLFILTLIVLTFLVSLPQSETIKTAYDTPTDLVRFALGVAVCLWLAIQLFVKPPDAAGYRSWIYLGVPAIPFALICLYYAW